MIGKYRYKNKSLITVISILISILLLICLNTIAYSAFYSTVLITGDAYARVEKNIRITDISLTSVEGDGFGIYSPSYSSNTISTGVQLNSLNSSVKYQVEVVNFGNVDMAITNIVKQSDSNTNITFDVNYESNVISVGSTLTIDITYRYDASVTTLPSDKVLETVLFFEFGDLSKPTLAANSSWYKGSTAKSKIKSISIVEQYTPPTDGTLLESWDASADNNKSVVVYVLSNYNLILSGNGQGKILANVDSSYAFAEFTYLTSITGFDIFDTSNVTNMSYMFKQIAYNSSNFSMNISNFNTENVTTLSGLFFEGGNTSNSWSIGNLTNWKTGKVTNMSHLFYEAAESVSNFNVGDLGKWDVSNVTNMSYLFYGLAREVSNFSLGDLDNWNTGKVTNMSAMFSNCGENATTWNIGDLSNWNVSNVTNMSSMFSVTGYMASSGCDLGDLSGWNVSKVTNMSRMFFYSGFMHGLKTFDMGKWNVSRVKDMSSMMMGVSKLYEFNVGNWNVSSVTNMSQLFKQVGIGVTGGKLDLSGWNVSNVTNMSNMFESGSSLYVLDISGWNTAKVTNMSGMFKSCSGLKTIYVGNGWTTSSVTNSTNMFSNSTKLPNFNSSVVDKTNAHSNSGGYLTFKS